MEKQSPKAMYKQNSQKPDHIGVAYGLKTSIVGNIIGI